VKAREEKRRGEEVEWRQPLPPPVEQRLVAIPHDVYGTVWLDPLTGEMFIRDSRGLLRKLRLIEYGYDGYVTEYGYVAERGPY